MKATSLRAFVDRVSETKRLGFADLRRLQRDILPEGPHSREEVQALLALDAALKRADSGWLDYLREAVKGFVLSAASGVSGAEDAGWLVSALGAAPPKTALALARAIVTRGSVRRRPRPPALV